MHRFCASTGGPGTVVKKKEQMIPLGAPGGRKILLLPVCALYIYIYYVYIYIYTYYVYIYIYVLRLS